METPGDPQSTSSIPPAATRWAAQAAVPLDGHAVASRAPCRVALSSARDACPSANPSATSTAFRLLSSVNNGQIRRQHPTPNSLAFRSESLPLPRRNASIVCCLRQNRY
jgi:hypothetical protein